MPWLCGAPSNSGGRVPGWEGGRGAHSPAGSSAPCAPGITGNTQLCHFPLHPSGPGRSVDLSWTHTGATTFHHPCLSRMPTEQVPTGRLLLICPVLSFPDKTQLGEWHQGRAERKALAGLGDVGEQEQSWPRPPGTGLQGKAECIRVHLWSLASRVCVCLSLGPTFLCHVDTARQASACLCQMMGPALWKASEAASIALPKYYKG